MHTLRSPHELLHVGVHHNSVVEQVVIEENLHTRRKLLLRHLSSVEASPGVQQDHTQGKVVPSWSEYHVASLSINITQGHLLDLGMAGDLRELLYQHRVDLVHLLGDTLAVEEGIHHHSLLLEPVTQHLLGIRWCSSFRLSRPLVSMYLLCVEITKNKMRE